MEEMSLKEFENRYFILEGQGTNRKLKMYAKFI